MTKNQRTERNTRDYYLGNPNLPTDRTTYDWSPKMVSDLKKSHKNILWFAENFFFIKNLDRGKEKIKLHSFQKKILRNLRDNRFNILLASRQIGKALALDTPIPTPNGWTTMGDLKSGDKVYDRNGQPCNVTHAHDILHNRDCYEVIFDNGEKITADGEHLWHTQDRSERRKNSPGSVKTTKEIFDTQLAKTALNEPNHRIGRSLQGVEYNYQDIDIDPYLLGLWLGDGGNESSSITVGLRDIVSTTEILNEKLQEHYDIKVHEYNNDVFTLKCNFKKGNKRDTSLHSQLKEAGLYNNKHIPDNYMFNTREIRKEILSGLIDSDGYVNKAGTVQFYNTNIELVKQVKRLVESIGYKVTYKEIQPTLNGVKHKTCARITFKPNEYVCRIPFKRERIDLTKRETRQDYHYIKEVRRVDSVPVRCITVDSADSLYLCGEQYIPTHNTTMFTIYALWTACFNEDQQILIVANKEQTAIEIFRRVRLAYELLPNYLKPGVISYGKTGMELENGSAIRISTTSSDAGRGSSCNVLLLDELAFIDPGLVADFWRSVYPIISSSKRSKIFIASTANGTNNLFYRLYDDAVNMRNSTTWNPVRVDWWEVPGRDEAWKLETIASMGSERDFAQEYGNEFIETGDSLLSAEILEKLNASIREPIHVLYDGAYKVWESPNPDHIYTAGVDVAEGIGQDSSVVQIFDITDLTDIRQVACYRNDMISPYEFTTVVKDILYQWGCPPAMIERNNQGGQVVDRLYHEHRYNNIVSFNLAVINNEARKDKRLGVQAHTNTKYKGVTNMRYWLNELCVTTLRDTATINELKTFVRQSNGTWSAVKGTGSHDDTVMAMMWSLAILENCVCSMWFDIERYDMNNRPLIIHPLDHGIRRFENSIINRYDDNDEGDPVMFFNSPDAFFSSEQQQLEMDGWKILDNSRSNNSRR